MSPYAAFRSRDFRLLAGAMFLSNFGLQMLSVAVSWDLYVVTKSAVVLGNVGLVQVAPYLLFALYAGHIADRHDRRRVAALTQLLMLAASVFLAAGTRSVAMIYGCLFVISTARALQGPARAAILPLVVPANALHNAITWQSSAWEVANVSGPALAGLLVAWSGSQTVYALQCFCAGLTLACFYALKFRVAAHGKETAPGRRDLLEGVRFVWHDELLLPAMSLDMFAVLFGGATALLPIFASEILHTDASGFGWLRAAPALGAVSMALAAAHAPQPRRAGRALLASVAAFGAATVVFGLSRSLWLSFVMLLLTGAFDNISVVLRQSLVQTKPPDRVRGRVMGVQGIFISCSNQLGAVESGWTAAWFGPVISVAGGGLATIAIVAAFAAGSRALRRWKQ